METAAQTQSLPTAEEIVSHYLRYRVYIKEKEDQLAAFLAPFKEAMTTLEDCAALLLQQTGQRALSTNAGTAFHTTHTSAVMEDRVAWLDFVFGTEGGREGLTNHVSKEFVEAYMANNEGRLPPGVKYNRFQKVTFRKA